MRKKLLISSSIVLLILLISLLKESYAVTQSNPVVIYIQPEIRLTFIGSPELIHNNLGRTEFNYNYGLRISVIGDRYWNLTMCEVNVYDENSNSSFNPINYTLNQNQMNALISNKSVGISMTLNFMDEGSYKLFFKHVCEFHPLDFPQMVLGYEPPGQSKTFTIKSEGDFDIIKDYYENQIKAEEQAERFFWLAILGILIGIFGPDIRTFIINKFRKSKKKKVKQIR